MACVPAGCTGSDWRAHERYSLLTACSVSIGLNFQNKTKDSHQPDTPGPLDGNKQTEEFPVFYLFTCPVSKRVQIAAMN